MAVISGLAKAQIGAVILLFLAARGFSADWPQWRGLNRDAVAHGVTIPEKWPKSLAEEWKVQVGEGVSSPVVVGDSIYLLARQKADEEVVVCLDLASGKETWRSAYAAPYKLGGPAHGYEGPRSTPAVADGRIFTFGISGILSCLDAKTGKALWRKDFVKQYPHGTAPGWGTSASPLIDGDLCIIHVGGPDIGGLTAFNTRTGEAKWCYDGDGPAYGSPILVDLAGERQVVTLTLNFFLGVSAATGKLVWRLPCREIHSENCLTPILYKDLLIYAGRKESPRAIRLENGAAGITPKEIWKGDGPTLYMSTPILAGDFMFGFSAGLRPAFLPRRQVRKTSPAIAPINPVWMIDCTPVRSAATWRAIQPNGAAILPASKLHSAISNSQINRSECRVIWYSAAPIKTPPRVPSIAKGILSSRLTRSGSVPGGR